MFQEAVGDVAWVLNQFYEGGRNGLAVWLSKDLNEGKGDVEAFSGRGSRRGVKRGLESANEGPVSKRYVLSPFAS